MPRQAGVTAILTHWSDDFHCHVLNALRCHPSSVSARQGIGRRFTLPSLRKYSRNLGQSAKGRVGACEMGQGSLAGLKPGTVPEAIKNFGFKGEPVRIVHQCT